jgi:hypothetical protein
MSKKRLVLFVSVLAVELVCGTYVWGRPIEDWPFDKLFKHSDVVVIATFQSSKRCGKDIKDKPPADYLDGVITTLDIKHVVKGDHKGKQIEVFHYRLDDSKDRPLIINGPLLASFHKSSSDLKVGKSASVALGPPVYMIFLKKRTDGKYECISGQFDSELSVMQIMGPLPKQE